MDPSRDSWRCFVDDHGQVMEFGDRTGAQYIVAFRGGDATCARPAELDRDIIVFHLADHSERWHRVEISRHAALLGRRVATVQMTLVSPPFNLTVRELDILTLVAIGLSNENIALRLDISKRTIQKHVEESFRQMRCGAARHWPATRYSRASAGCLRQAAYTTSAWLTEIEAAASLREPGLERQNKSTSTSRHDR